MTSRNWCLRFRATLWLVVVPLATCGFDSAFGQQAGNQSPAPAAGQEARAGVPATAQGVKATEGRLLHRVHLNVDGAVKGRVSVLGPLGEYVPVRATVVFVQQGKTAGSALSDEWGKFQVPGLQAGVYSTFVVGREGVAAFAVQVLPYAKDVPDELAFLDATLASAADVSFLAQLLNGEFPAAAAMPAAMPAAAAGTGGGSGGGGILPWVGAGMGIAGLATALGTSEPASPHRP
jgi:hypothetical protein